MFFTLSKRFELSSSRRLHLADRSAGDNTRLYGAGAAGRWGQGCNYIAHPIFSGPIDRATGMLMNVSEVKQRVNTLLNERYDHKYLNLDTPPFDQIPPTPELIARQLLHEIQPLFADSPARPVAVHLMESPDAGATAYLDGRIERDIWLEFSAARQTWSPHLSPEENEKLFGVSARPHGHGHNYRLRLVLGDTWREAEGIVAEQQEIDTTVAAIREKFDHRQINLDIPELKGEPVTTESIARLIFRLAHFSLPVIRVQLYEMPWFFVEYRSDNSFSLGYENSFSAAHRLNSNYLSEEANRTVYGKCNNPNGHGHYYRVEATVGGAFDERSGTIFDLGRAMRGYDEAIAPWRNKHLDWETEDFENAPSTGENIAERLWEKLNAQYDNRLTRLRLWETMNNRFTLRNYQLLDQAAETIQESR